MNIQPVSGYRKPWGAKDFRKCTWCGARSKAVRIGDDPVALVHVGAEAMTADLWCPGCGQSLEVNRTHDCPHDAWLEPDDRKYEDYLQAEATIDSRFCGG